MGVPQGLTPRRLQPYDLALTGHQDRGARRCVLFYHPLCHFYVTYHRPSLWLYNTIIGAPAVVHGFEYKPVWLLNILHIGQCRATGALQKRRDVAAEGGRITVEGDEGKERKGGWGHRT